MRNAGTVLHHATIYDRVWGYDFGPGANSLRVYVGYLRRKLGEAGARPLIRTVRGVGYALRDPGRSRRRRASDRLTRGHRRGMRRRGVGRPIRESSPRRVRPWRAPSA